MASKRRTPLALSDSDDDSDDELLARHTSVSRSSKRRKALDEAAEKKKRMDRMNELLKNGSAKLERETRMGKICQENNLLMRKESLDEKENDTNAEGNKLGNVVKKEPDTSSFEYYEPKDSRQTNCLGSRITLQFSSEVSVPSTWVEAMVPKGKDACYFMPCWFDLGEALTDLRTILAADRQKRKNPSSFTILREELLRICESKNSPRVVTSYLTKALMSKKDQDRVGRIHVNVLRWMMVLACSSVTIEKDSDSIDHVKEESNQKKQGKKQGRSRTSEGSNNPLLSRRLLMEAQMGAYRTLSQLWSRDLGFPLQESEESGTYLLSIRALPRQLRQWFGSSFSFESAAADSSTSDKLQDENKSNHKLIRTTNSHTTLIRFLELWALALQKQTDSDTVKGNVHLVQFHCDKNRASFRNDVSDAILSVLWAGLHPSFASSISAKNDGNRSIQTIVACLLDQAQLEDTYYKNKSGDVDKMESYEQWMESLSERFFTTWSKLGRGRKGTDAYEDKHAWLSLARSVTRLVRIGGSDCYQKVGDSYIRPEDYDRRENRILNSLKEFQLILCRHLLAQAFAEEDEQGMQNFENTSEGKATTEVDGRSRKWLSSLMDDEIERMKIPLEIRSSRRWRAMSLAIAGSVKLAGSFPEDEASKCYALMDICTVCFHSAIVELEPELENKILKQKENKVVDNEGEELPIANDKSVDDEPSETDALYNALTRLEQAGEIISNRCRGLIMRNVCFPWTSQMAESLRNYVRSRKGIYAPFSTTNKTASMKQQSKINNFFHNAKSSSEGITSN